MSLRVGGVGSKRRGSYLCSLFHCVVDQQLRRWAFSDLEQY